MIPVEPAITEYLHRKACVARIPLSGSFELTPVCNMSCKMCYVRMTRQQQEAIAPLHSASEWLSLAAEAKKHGMLYLLLTGGEPFLHPQFREILESLHQMGFVISINSNGTLIDEACVDWLRSCPPNRINITLYGASDETYCRLCGNPNGFSQVTRAVDLLLDAGISVKLNYSITAYNAPDFDAIFAFAKERNLPVQASSYMFPPLRRAPEMVGQNERLSPELAAYYSARIEAAQNGTDAFLESPDLDLPPLSGDSDDNCMDTGEGIRCRAGKCSFWVTWDGRMMPCGMLPGSREKSVFTHDFGDCWREVQAAADAIRLPAKCASCTLKDACRSCAAMVMTETGSYDQVPQYRCAMASAFPAARKQLKAELLHRRDNIS